jgi:hypothetical protein
LYAVLNDTIPPITLPQDRNIPDFSQGCSGLQQSMVFQGNRGITLMLKRFTGDKAICFRSNFCQSGGKVELIFMDWGWEMPQCEF